MPILFTWNCLFAGEFNDGVKLCALVAALQNKPGIKGMKANPKNRHQKIENVTLALQATKVDKIKIVNIGELEQLFEI